MTGTLYHAEKRAEEVPEPVPPRRRPSARRIAAAAVAVVAVFAGAAVGYSTLVQTVVYGAQADFVVTPRPELSDAAADRAMLTQVMIVESDPVLRPVADRVGMRLSRLREAVTAEIVDRSNIMRVTVGDRDRARAVAIVQLIAEAYLRTATTAAPAPAGAGAGADQTPPTRTTILSAAALLEDPLQPRPLRALAAGLLLGLLAAAVVVTVLLRPRFLTRPPSFWT